MSGFLTAGKKPILTPYCPYGDEIVPPWSWNIYCAHSFIYVLSSLYTISSIKAYARPKLWLFRFIPVLMWYGIRFRFIQEDFFFFCCLWDQSEPTIVFVAGRSFIFVRFVVFQMSATPVLGSTKNTKWAITNSILASTEPRDLKTPLTKNRKWMPYHIRTGIKGNNQNLGTGVCLHTANSVQRRRKTIF